MEINAELFGKISSDVAAEFGMGGLAGTLYEKYARECAKQYLEAVIPAFDYCPDCGHPRPHHKGWCKRKGQT